MTLDSEATRPMHKAPAPAGSRRRGTRTAALTFAALTGFAANSLLCRMALGARAIDPASFTAVRLLSGALVLALLVRVTPAARGAGRSGSLRAALALFVYAIAFSFAYLRLTTGTGALILFAAVQLAMLGVSVLRGERPSARQWLGIALSLGGLVALTLPGLAAPEPLAAATMALAGVAWGGYSLLGRASTQPLATTADNFARGTPLALSAWGLALIAGAVHGSLQGVLLASASGALASGVGYSLWYAALPALSRTTAAVVQLSVPVLAALAGVLVLGESLSDRLVFSGVAILTGVALALRAR
jgi:drug/metabolite transporter (DMT)-like permease